MPDSEERWRLTSEENDLILRHLVFYRSLDMGERAPETEAQRHFVAVCQCAAKAETTHEIAYVKYRAQESKRRTSMETNSDIDEFGEGVPKPGWFSDEGWKRMRGQYRSNSD